MLNIDHFIQVVDGNVSFKTISFCSCLSIVRHFEVKSSIVIIRIAQCIQTQNVVQKYTYVQFHDVLSSVDSWFTPFIHTLWKTHVKSIWDRPIACQIHFSAITRWSTICLTWACYTLHLHKSTDQHL